MTIINISAEGRAASAEMVRLSKLTDNDTVKQLLTDLAADQIFCAKVVDGSNDPAIYPDPDDPIGALTADQRIAELERECERLEHLWIKAQRGEK